MEQARHDLRAFGSADLAFHFKIVKGAGNDLFVTIYRGLIPSLGERCARTTYTNVELTKHTLVDHRALNAAVQTLDEEAAVRRRSEHINWSRMHMHEILLGTRIQRKTSNTGSRRK